MPFVLGKFESYPHPEMAGVVVIPLSKGMFTIIDEEDLSLVNNRKWFAHKQSRHHNYACSIMKITSGRRGIRKTILMHRVILGSSCEGHIVDHVNGNALDNRRINLRICTLAQNIMNSKKNRNSRSAYKGIHRINRYRGGWIARITINGKRLHFPLRKTPEEAARDYDAAARLYFGEFAKTNFDNPS